MAFYDLNKSDRVQLTAEISAEMEADFRQHSFLAIRSRFADEDTYIRKTAYIAVGRIYSLHPGLRLPILDRLKNLFSDEEHKVRQTVVNAAGEIGKSDFGPVVHFFDTGLFDPHHAVRNAVIGSVKKMGEKNPEPVLAWARQYLHHTDKEIRREICHGIELRGRTHPQDILPLLRELQFDKTKRVRWTLVHVIGQIAYKKGCLETVMNEITSWENKDLASDAVTEIIDVHHRYRNFSFYSQDEAKEIIEKYII